MSLFPSEVEVEDNENKARAAASAPDLPFLLRRIGRRLNRGSPSPKTGRPQQLPSYGSCPTLSPSDPADPGPQWRVPSPLPRASPPPALLMEPTATTASADDESSPPPTPTAAESSAVEGDNAATPNEEGGEEAEEGGGGEGGEEQTNDTDQQSEGRRSRHMMANTYLTPIFQRLLRRTALADRLEPYPLLYLLSTNGRYAFLGFVAVYLLFVLLIWIPLWLMSLLVTEFGVYAFLVSTGVYVGRCVLRLLAFPGTNVRVYGEVENEFARYSARMLKGGCGAIEDFVKALRSAGTEDADGKASEADKVRRQLGMDENEGWCIVDVPATYRRAVDYKNRVFGVYLEVLHCLLEENGQGYDPFTPRTPTSTESNGNGARNGFYSLGDSAAACRDTCKRNLCCANGELQRSITDAEGTNLPPTHSPTNSSIDGTFPSRSKSKYGNNPLVGDIGNMGNLTQEARSDGRELYELLKSLLHDFSELESSASNVLRLDEKQLTNVKLSHKSMQHLTALMHRTEEFRELLSRIHVPPPSDADGSGGTRDTQHEEEEVGAEAVRNRLEEQGGTASGGGSAGSTAGMVRSAVRAFGSMIDPPPHGSIFGLDVIRGTFLARYRGARQFWVDRGGGGKEGKLDVLLVPSLAGDARDVRDASSESFLPLSPRKGRAEGVSALDDVGRPKVRAVLYCNPNAGLVEAATGLGLTGGNVKDAEEEDEVKEPTCWTEYYIEHGYDVYLFNYAGYGRSLGGRSKWNETTTEFNPGFLGTLKRVLFSTFVAFKPSSESLKSDAAAVARHLVDVVGVDELVIHGESIGGMAAAGAARALTAAAAPTTAPTPTPKTVLICDRTFCNLEATAQRLVGQWTGNAIRLLTPMWSTDVACDFLAAECPKVVANDCTDEIIHDYSSLKAGLAFAGELTRGRTNGVGWMMAPPLEYRMADLDNVGLASSRMASTGGGENPPTWPADKHIAWVEAYHFAACVKRIGKLATTSKKLCLMDLEDDEEGVEVSYLSSEELSTPKSTQKVSETKHLIKIWNSLACCDGLCGHPLGHAVKEGFDCTVAWLCCAVVFGSHVLAEKAEIRWDKQQKRRSGSLNNSGLNSGSQNAFLPEDFDLRPVGYQWDEDDIMRHPLPIPLVISSLKEMNEEKNSLTEQVEAELNYVVGVLEYVVSRLTSKESSALTIKRRSGQESINEGAISTGLFLNLKCGHNNQYSLEERQKLMSLIRRLCGSNPV